jgi:phosphate/sulfate permease
MILAWFVGSTVMVACYLVGASVIEGWPTAQLGVPFNTFQALLGGVVGIPLALAVRRAYPAVDQLGRRRTWHE